MSDAVPPTEEVLRAKSRYHPATVSRRGRVVVKDSGPWSTTVHTLLRHLADVGFTAAPQVVDSGFDADGRELLTYIDGEFTQPGPWSLEGAAAVGRLLRVLHTATASYRSPPAAVWRPWFGRDLGGPRRVIGHGDVAPWNLVARDGLPVALIDWEYAGPVDPLVDLAQACWLNVKLHDDLVAAREGLPPLATRAQQLRVMVDAYGLSARQRRGFVDRMIEFAVASAANEVDEADITPELTPLSLDAAAPWGIAWRIRAAAWMYRHRRTLQDALA